MRSALYTGTVMHARKTPKENVFRYRVCFYLLDLDELPELDRRVRLFGWNRRNVVSLHEIQPPPSQALAATESAVTPIPTAEFYRLHL